MSASRTCAGQNGMTSDDARAVLEKRGEHETLFTITLLERGQAMVHPRWRGAADHLLVTARNGDHGYCALCSVPWTTRRLIEAFAAFEFVGSPLGGSRPLCRECIRLPDLSMKIIRRVADELGLERPMLHVFSPGGRA